MTRDGYIKFQLPDEENAEPMHQFGPRGRVGAGLGPFFQWGALRPTALFLNPLALMERSWGFAFNEAQKERLVLSPALERLSITSRGF